MGIVTRIILGIIGAIFGGFCGVMLGKYSIYSTLNSANTINTRTIKQEQAPLPKQDASGKIIGSLVGFFFMIIGIILFMVFFQKGIEDLETYGTALVFGILLILFGGFVGFGVLFSKN